MDAEDVKSKAHRERKSGPKAEKKKKRNESRNLDGKNRNPKAFTFQSNVRAARQAKRKLDVQSKKHHVPLVDRTPLEPPPIVVAVIGPPNVGKSTLIKSILKNFTRQNLTTIKGPMTIVSGVYNFCLKVFRESVSLHLRYHDMELSTVSSTQIQCIHNFPSCWVTLTL